VHAVHAPNDDTTQCTAQGDWLHERVSAECGHAAPPFCGSVIWRVRDCEPAPHDLVHTDQPASVNTEKAQSTGQPALLQLRVSSRYGHA
jgi:hypothetical protein